MNSKTLGSSNIHKQKSGRKAGRKRKEGEEEEQEGREPWEAGKGEKEERERKLVCSNLY